MDEVVRAVRQVLGNARDNLARAEHQRRADPRWRSGDGESIDAVIDDYRAEVDRIKRDAARYGIEVS